MVYMCDCNVSIVCDVNIVCVVENEGLKISDGWFLESVGVVCPDGVKWNCPFNQWLSLHHTDCQVMLLLSSRISFKTGSQYDIM